jgi:transcriptional regulator with XRE-family HTH domain
MIKPEVNMDITSREPVPTLPVPAERARLRKLFGVTQNEIAAHIGVTRQMVNRYEHGRSEPGGNARARYAELLATWARSESQISTEIKKAGDLIDQFITDLPGKPANMQRKSS